MIGGIENEQEGGREGKGQSVLMLQGLPLVNVRVSLRSIIRRTLKLCPRPNVKERGEVDAFKDSLRK